jgi:hypothetical protein
MSTTLLVRSTGKSPIPSSPPHLTGAVAQRIPCGVASISIVAILLLTGGLAALAGPGSSQSITPPPTPFSPISSNASGPLALDRLALSLDARSPSSVHQPWTCHGLRALGTPACGGTGSPGTIASPSTTPLAWQNVPPVRSPPPQATYDFEMAYDSADGYVVLLGAKAGANGAQGPTDMWSFSAGTWTQLHPPVLPKNCEGSSIAYDDVDKVVVFLGGPNWGFSGAPRCSSANETWTYHGGNWTQIHPKNTPSGRFGAALTNDSADGYLLLFGGANPKCAGGFYCNDTWKFVGGNWTQLHPKSSPSAREESGIAYDTADGYVLLFGGVSAANTPPRGDMNDTWTYLNGTWTQRFPRVSPPGPEPDAFSYDATDRVVVYTTAYNWTADRPEITWTYHAGAWRAVGYPGPVERLSAGSAFDYGGGYMLFFGGTGAVSVSDSWAFHANHWRELPPLPALTGASMAFDSTDGYLVLYGGIDGSYVSDLTWIFQAGTWTDLATTVQPPPLVDASMTFDALDGYLLLFGGRACPLYQDYIYCNKQTSHQTWAFSAGVWMNKTTKISPASREVAGMAFDAKDHYVLLFGGVGASGGYLGDTWTYARGNWTRLLPTVSPGARGGAAVAYDAKDGYVVLFGGRDILHLALNDLNDTGQFVGGVWTKLAVLLAPPARYLAAIAYDAKGSFLALFGGASGANSLNDTWTFSAGNWSSVVLLHSPGAGMAFDAKGGFLLLFGGESSLSGGLRDTWKFR